MAFSGESSHRCKCFGDEDSPDGSWAACPPDLCEADVLLARVGELEAKEKKLLELLYEDDGLNGVVPQLHRAEDAIVEIAAERDAANLLLHGLTNEADANFAWKSLILRAEAAEAEVARLHYAAESYIETIRNPLNGPPVRQEAIDALAVALAPKEGV